MEGNCDLELGLRLAGAYHEVDDRGRLEAASVSGRTQWEHLTIIYKGEVCIYENVSEVQARAIMLLASGGEMPPRLFGVNTVKELTLNKNLPAPRSKSSEGAPSALTMKRSLPKSSEGAPSALTMKRSLQRFLQKRKLRMQKSSASPY